MEVTITPPKDVIVIQERTRTISQVTIIELIDNPTKKTVVAKTNEVGIITLWSGADYDAIGQWTDSDVEARIQTIYT